MVNRKPVVCCMQRARQKRVLRLAAQILDGEAETLKACSTLNDDWGDEVAARRDYEEMKEVAHDLLMIEKDILDCEPETTGHTESAPADRGRVES